MFVAAAALIMALGVWTINFIFLEKFFGRKTAISVCFGGAGVCIAAAIFYIAAAEF